MDKPLLCGVCQEGPFDTADSRKNHMKQKHADWLKKFDKLSDPMSLVERVEDRLSTPIEIPEKPQLRPVSEMTEDELKIERVVLLHRKNLVLTTLFRDTDNRIKEIDTVLRPNKMIKKEPG